MPYVTITSSPGLAADTKKALLEQSSDAVVQSIGAPLANVRVLFNELPDGHYLNGGKFNTKVLMFLVELVAGRTEEKKAALIAALSRAGCQTTGVPESEIRVRVADFPASDMGLAGGISAKQTRR